MHEEPRDKMNIPVIVTVSLVTVIFVMLTVVGTQAFFRFEQEKEARVKIIEAPNDALDRLNNQQLAEIQQYRWVDRENGLAAIPIDRAMAIYAKEESGK